MQRSSFQHIKTDNTSNCISNEVIQGIESNQPRLNEIVNDAADLADCALFMFRGLYPVESPWFFWGESRELPWMTHYWSSDGEFMNALPIEQEIQSIQSELNLISSPLLSPAITYSSKYFDSSQLRIQGLLVEGLTAIDNFLNLVLSNRPIDAMPWLTAAYKYQLEATHFASQIAQTTANAKLAAKSRHAASRTDKKVVFKWCDENMSRFSSMDDAAIDIAESFVPQKFRAVRQWMTEWKRLRSAGTL